MAREELYLLKANEGRAVFGCLAPGIQYLRLEGMLSVGLGLRLASRLDVLLAGTSSWRSFTDCSLLSNYDFAARDALVRVFMARRKQLASLSVLATGTVVVLAARAVAPMFGGALTVTGDKHAFDLELQRLVPHVQQKLDSKLWEAPLSSLPPPG